MMGAPNDKARSQIARSYGLKCKWNEIGDEDNVETKFLRCKDNGRKSENARNKSEMMEELDSLFLC
jgi:hypothetical protein